ncbi:GAF and ANTAR domain-containing protein [Actinoplanes philippinensis]|uniref:GAF and ANTAR domain-containing protein n=1 Tax=Actinoplanes philippinensis TaxID=35752 RepID=UPI003F4CBBF6
MAVSAQDLTPALTRLLALLVDTPPMDDFLTRAVRLAADVIAPAVAGGITTRRDHHPVTVAAGDPFAARVDELQYGAGEGPCLAALETGHVLQTDDMAAETCWDRYRPHAIAHGVVSSLSLPLIVGERTVAVLNLYARTSAAFGGRARRHGEAFAAQCSAALVVAWRLADQANLQQQLIEAMAWRSVIDQALGILMAQQRCSAEEAFDCGTAMLAASEKTAQDGRGVAGGSRRACHGRSGRMVDRVHLAIAVSGVELYPLIFPDSAAAATRDGGEVRENVRAAVVTGDQSEPPVGTEPSHGPGGHDYPWSSRRTRKRIARKK